MPKKPPRPAKSRPPDPHGVDSDWRLFIALPIPEPVQAMLAAVVARLEPMELPMRWVASDSVHLTVQFIRDTPPERAELLRMALSPVIARHRRLVLRTGALGVFPDPAEPRVLWVGLSGQTDRLTALHRDVTRALTRLEFPIDDRAFHSHLTLGRVRDNPPKDLPVRIWRLLADPSLQELLAEERADLAFDEVQLLRTVTERGTVRHLELARYPLSPE